MASSAEDADTVALVAADSDSQHKLSYAKQAHGKQCRVSIVRAGSNISQVGYVVLGFRPTEAPAS